MGLALPSVALHQRGYEVALPLELLEFLTAGTETAAVGDSEALPRDDFEVVNSALSNNCQAAEGLRCRKCGSITTQAGHDGQGWTLARLALIADRHRCSPRVTDTGGSVDEIQDCTCVEVCDQDRKTACGLSGRRHVHPASQGVDSRRALPTRTHPVTFDQQSSTRTRGPMIPRRVYGFLSPGAQDSWNLRAFERGARKRSSNDPQQMIAAAELYTGNRAAAALVANDPKSLTASEDRLHAVHIHSQALGPCGGIDRSTCVTTRTDQCPRQVRPSWAVRRTSQKPRLPPHTVLSAATMRFQDRADASSMSVRACAVTRTEDPHPGTAAVGAARGARLGP